MRKVTEVMEPIGLKALHVMELHGCEVYHRGDFSLHLPFSASVRVSMSERIQKLEGAEAGI